MPKCKKFFTKFDLPVRTLRLMDFHDNVDRLSYVDSNLLINSFMDAGKLLMMRVSSQNKMQKESMYSPEQAMNSDVGISSVVYPVDPVIASELNEILQNEIAGMTSVETVGSEKHSDSDQTGAGTSTPADNTPADATV